VRWNRRRRGWWPKLCTLREGDIVWVKQNYAASDPILLVQRVRHKKYVAHCEKMRYWYEGIFLSLMTGKLQTKKLGNGMTYGEVTRAPKPEPPDEEDDAVE